MLGRPETVSLALVETMNAEVEKIPDAQLVWIVAGQGHQGEICAGVQIHVALENVPKDFLAVRLFDLHRH